MKRSLLSVAQALQAHLVGDGAVEVSGIASIALATSSDLVFVEDEKSLLAALESPAAAVIVSEFPKADSLKEKAGSKPLLIAKHPKLVFARAARLLYSPPDRPPGAHPSAVVHASARLGKDASVAERVVIGEKAEDRRSDLDWCRRGDRRGCFYRKRLRNLSQRDYLSGSSARRSRDRSCWCGIGSRWLRLCS